MWSEGFEEWFTNNQRIGRRLAPIMERIYAGGWEKRKALREFYEVLFPMGWDPYPFDINWWRVMESPAEEMAFQVTRSNGMNTWMQYPAGKYFLDFADPWMKIGIEVDGKQYHDPERDKARDEELADQGWHIYRVSGAEAYRPADEEGESDDWRWNTIEGVVYAIRAIYYGKRNRCGDDYRILDRHRLADFEIGTGGGPYGWKHCDGVIW